MSNLLPDTVPAPVSLPAAGRWFSWWHLAIWLSLWSAFTAWTWLITSTGLSDKSYAVPATLATVLGPMTGAISRGNQSCCLEFSLKLLPYALACAAVGVAVQFVPTPRHVVAQVVRLSLWSLGWFVWFASGIVSFAHALS